MEKLIIIKSKIAKFCFFLLLFSVVFGAFQSCKNTVENKPNYSYVNAPKIQPHFIPLPFGSIEAKGWMRDWLVLTKNGLVGNSEAFKKGWQDGMPEPFFGEQSAYWVDGMLQTGYALRDTTLIHRAQHDISAFLKNKKYVSSWGFGVYGRAIMADYKGTQDSAILKDMTLLYQNANLEGFWEITKLFGNLKPVFGEGVTADIPSIVENEPRNLVQVESMLDAFSYGADSILLTKSLLGLKRYESRFINHFLDRDRETCNTNNGCFLSMHGVTYNELTKLWALAYLYNGNPEYLQTSINAYKELDENNMLPIGVNSSNENLMGIDAVASAETCDVSDFINSSIALYRITGSRAYGDKIERALFNAGAAAWSHDCKTHVYSQSPNRISLTSGVKLKGHFEFKSMHDPLCCTGNICRMIPNFVLHSWMATHDGGVAAMLYSPCEVSVNVGRQIPVKIIEQTNYPFDEQITLTIKSDSKVEFPLYLRIPSWCKSPQIEVMGKVVNVQINVNGFAVIQREWKNNDKVIIRFPMNTNCISGITKSNGAVSSLDKSEKLTSGLPYSFIERGPLLYAVNLADTTADFRYALLTDSMDYKVNNNVFPLKFTWGKVPVTITCNAQPIEWNDFPNLEKSKIKRNGKVKQIKLVPYGSTQGIRISMFPIIE